ARSRARIPIRGISRPGLRDGEKYVGYGAHTGRRTPRDRRNSLILGARMSWTVRRLSWTVCRMSWTVCRVSWTCCLASWTRRPVSWTARPEGWPKRPANYVWTSGPSRGDEWPHGGDELFALRE